MPWAKEERFRRGKKVWHTRDKNRYRVHCTQAALHYESTVDSGVYDSEIDLTPRLTNVARLGGITTRLAGYDFGYQDRTARQAQKAMGSIGFGGRKGESFLNLRPNKIGYLNTKSRRFQSIAAAPTFRQPVTTIERKTIGIADDDPSLFTLNVGTNLNLGSVWADGRNSVNYSVRLSGGQIEPVFTFDNWQKWISNNPHRDRAANTSFGVLMALDLNDVARIAVGNRDRNRLGDDFTWRDDLTFRNSARKSLAHIGAGQVFVPGRGGGVDIVKRIWRDDNNQWWFFMGANVAEMQRNLLPGQLVIDPPISEESIATNNDDAMQNGANMLLSGYAGNIIYLGGNASYHGGWIFQSVPIGNGDTVNSATLEPYQVGISAGTITATLYGIEENDAPVFVTTNNDITGRTRTAASTALTATNWPGNNTRALNWDVASIVQEIVDNAFWANTERLGFVGIGTSVNYTFVGFRDYNGSAVNAADFNADVTGGNEATIAGLIAPSGVLLRQTLKSPAGSMTPTSAFTKQTRKAVTGAVTPSGFLTRLVVFSIVIGGVLAFSGGLIKRTLKNVQGSLTPFGAALKQTQKSLAGVALIAGTLATLTALEQAVGGVLTPIGSLIKTTLKTVGGLFTPISTTTKETRKNVVGTVTPAGSDTKETRKSVDGTVAPTGDSAPRLTVLQSVAGAFTPGGVLATLFIAGTGAVARFYRHTTTLLSSLRHRR